ncbi:MAG TPA: DoxX family protein [Polyangiaceae bacterium]|nr:DoxX family protein [Polyangiaceae bacterium]
MEQRTPSQNWKTTGYWLSTGLLAFALLTGGAAQLVQQAQTVEGMTHLGYPPYFVSILGFWKLLGALALLAPRLPRLKEWAYAGAFFDMTGAVVSHVMSGDSVARFVAPLVFALCAVASWALRPQSRTLGTLGSLEDIMPKRVRA